MSVAALDLVDADLPGLAVVGHDGDLAGLLDGAGEQLLERPYLRYKPGTSVVATLRLASGPAFAYAVSAAARPKLAKLVERAPAGSVLLHRPTDGLVVARSAADRDLPGLAAPDRLARLAGSGTAPGWTTLAYKPQRRWVGRPAAAGPGTPVVRAYRPAELPATLTGWRLAARLSAADPGVGLPAIRTTSSRSGLVAVDWLDGDPLDRLVADGRAPADVLSAVGAALARLHAALDPRPTALSPDGDGPAGPVLRELARLRPELVPRAQALRRRLAVTAPRPIWSHPVHGDFSADQVVVGDRGVGVADWDRAGWGDPGADLGSLLAAGLPDAAYRVVLDGYAGVRDVPDSVGWHAVAAGMQRLTEPLRRCRPGWRSEIAERLAVLEDRAALLTGTGVTGTGPSGDSRTSDGLAEADRRAAAR